jgi:hypothetical protein
MITNYIVNNKFRKKSRRFKDNMPNVHSVCASAILSRLPPWETSPNNRSTMSDPSPNSSSYESPSTFMLHNESAIVQFGDASESVVNCPSVDRTPNTWSLSPDPWMVCSSKALSRNDFSNNPLRPNGMLPTSSTMGIMKRNHLVRNGWDIRSLETIDPSDMIEWRLDEWLDYGLFPTRKVFYGKVQLKKYPADDDCVWWVRSMLDKSTDTYYIIPEPPYGEFQYHVTVSGCCIFYITWDISFYLLKPFIEEEVCNIIEAALDDMKVVNDYPQYYNDWNTNKSLKRRKTIKDYFLMIKKAFAYNGTEEYDGRIDDYIDEVDYYDILFEYRNIHFAVMQLASASDAHLVKCDQNYSYEYNVHVFEEWTKRTFEEVLTIIKSIKHRNVSLSTDDWSHILFSFGEGFMKIYGNNEVPYLSQKSKIFRCEFHEGSIYDSDSE